MCVSSLRFPQFLNGIPFLISVISNKVNSHDEWVFIFLY